MNLSTLLKQLDAAAEKAGAAKQTVEEALAAQADAATRYQQTVNAAQQAHREAVDETRQLEAQVQALIAGKIGEPTPNNRVRGS